MVHRPRTEECIGALAQAIRRDFCGLDQLKEKVNAAALAIQGSGWVWLVCPLRSLLRKAQRDTAQGYKADSLIISTTKDQDPLIDATVLFGIDMWCVAPSTQGGLADRQGQGACLLCALSCALAHHRHARTDLQYLNKKADYVKVRLVACCEPLADSVHRPYGPSSISMRWAVATRRRGARAKQRRDCALLCV